MLAVRSAARRRSAESDYVPFFDLRQAVFVEAEALGDTHEIGY